MKYEKEESDVKYEMVRLTAPELRALPIDELLARIEARMGHPLSATFKLRLALLHGAGVAGVVTVDVDPANGASALETMNYDALARWLAEEG